MKQTSIVSDYFNINKFLYKDRNKISVPILDGLIEEAATQSDWTISQSGLWEYRQIATPTDEGREKLKEIHKMFEEYYIIDSITNEKIAHFRDLQLPNSRNAIRKLGDKTIIEFPFTFSWFVPEGFRRFSLEP